MGTQSLEALALANEVRSGRARLKREVASGESLRAIIDAPPKCCERVTIGEVVTWPHRWGKTRGSRVLVLAGVSPTRKLGNLTDRERGSLVEQLRLAGVR